MNWFISRRVTEAQVELLRKLCDEKDKRIAELGMRIASLERQAEELKALFSKTSQFEVVEQGEDRVTLKMKPVEHVTGRAGFRSRRAQAEAQTHSTVNDSVAALEKRAEGEN